MSAQIQIRMNPAFQAQVAALVAPKLRGLAAFAENEAKRRCPVETGNLLRSGSSGVSLEGNDVFGWVVFAAHYAIFVELGTGRMAAQPYMRPALLALRGFISGGGGGF